MATLVLIRHGQSQWNLENKFTGWVDIDLSPLGKKEAADAAKKIASLKFDVAYTSVLIRAIHTLQIILAKIRQPKIPIIKDKALNERMYGDLQGLNKDDMRKKYGDEQVLLWRRSYDIRPPGGESLKDTAARTIPYFKKYVMKDLNAGKNVLIVAHGNSLRSIVMHLDKLTRDEVIKLNMGTGVPYVYEFDKKGKVLKKEILG